MDLHIHRIRIVARDRKGMGRITPKSKVLVGLSQYPEQGGDQGQDLQRQHRRVWLHR